MDDFAWATVSAPLRRFSSPRFTEFLPSPQSRVSGGAGESALIRNLVPFDRAVLSWNGEGTWHLEMRLQVDGAMTPYYLLGVLDGTRQRSAAKPELSRALPNSPAPSAAVNIDTLTLKNGKRATGFQLRATGSGDLNSLAVAHYQRSDRRFTDRPAVSGAWGTILPVPERSQRDVEEPRIGSLVCSPTSLSMMLEYHGSPYRTIDVARAVLDSQTRLYGNWPCNTGAIARLMKKGGWSAVVKMNGFHEVEREIVAGRPVALSHRWQPGDLSNAPISRSSGHLIVAVGFTKEGDVVVNDPAARAGEVRRTYKRRELFRTWQERGEGIAYVVHPLR
jgi:hypothetical protein